MVAPAGWGGGRSAGLPQAPRRAGQSLACFGLCETTECCSTSQGRSGCCRRSLGKHGASPSRQCSDPLRPGLLTSLQEAGTHPGGGAHPRPSPTRCLGARGAWTLTEPPMVVRGPRRPGRVPAGQAAGDGTQARSPPWSLSPEPERAAHTWSWILASRSAAGHSSQVSLQQL